MKPLAIIFIFLLSTLTQAQETEKYLSYLSTKITQGRSLEDRMSADQALLYFLDSVFQIPENYNITFGKYPQISDLSPEDEKFRLISWGIPQDAGEYLYNGILLLPTDSQTVIHHLVDSSMNYYFELEEIHGPDKWFGAMYYEIVHKRHKKTDHYLLLGWDGYSGSSNRKVIEPLIIDPKKGPLFGGNVFKMKDNPSRIILEYSQDAGVSLRYDAQMKLIIYDHLVPMDGAPIGMYSFYIPDFTYEGLEFKKGKWVHHSMVFPENTSEY